MTLKNIAEKVTGVLPLGSAFAYAERQLNKPVKERDTGIKMILKCLGHGFYAFGAAIFLVSGITFNSWTLSQYKQHFEKNRIEIAQSKEYKQKLFGVNGYAQKDNNPKISPSERFEVYKRAGLEDKVFFSELSVEDLEKAVKSYEADNQQ